MITPPSISPTPISPTWSAVRNSHALVGVPQQQPDHHHRGDDQAGGDRREDGDPPRADLQQDRPGRLSRLGGSAGPVRLLRRDSRHFPKPIRPPRTRSPLQHQRGGQRGGHRLGALVLGRPRRAAAGRRPAPACRRSARRCRPAPRNPARPWSARPSPNRRRTRNAVCRRGSPRRARPRRHARWPAPARPPAARCAPGTRTTVGVVAPASVASQTARSSRRVGDLAVPGGRDHPDPQALGLRDLQRRPSVAAHRCRRSLRC